MGSLTFLMCWFHYSVEILVTVRSNIYYLSHSEIVKVYEQVIGMNVYLRVLEKRETSVTAKARA